MKVCLWMTLFSACVGAFAVELPKGFEDAKLMEKVLAGKIVVEEVANTKLEYRVYLRSFFKKVSPDAFAALAVDYAKYPDLFEEILRTKTLAVSEDKTQYTYWADILIPYGIFEFHAYPEGKHTLKMAKDAISESIVVHEITNYKETLAQGMQSTRLIPYADGMLVEDDIHIKLVKDNAQSAAIKKQVIKQFSRMMETFRTALSGNP